MLDCSVCVFGLLGPYSRGYSYHEDPGPETHPHVVTQGGLEITRIGPEVYRSPLARALPRRLQSSV